MTIYDAAIRQNARRRASLQTGRKRSTRIALPPPLKGLDTRSPVNQLGAEDAYELVNWVPDAGSMRVREGSGTILGKTGPVLRLLAFSYLSQDKLVYVYRSAAGTYYLESIRDLDPIGGGFVAFATPRVVASPDISAAMFNGYLVMVNGVDDPFALYATSSIAGATTTLALTGMNAATLKGVKVFKNRLYFWGAEFGFWYLATNAVQGALTFFPLYSVAQRGGAIMSINAWTVDGGSGSDDFLVITTTKGEVIVYQGSDPSDPNDWAMVGRYQIGAPLSARGFLELDGKILVMTETDLEVLPDKFRRQQVTSKIGKALRDNVNQYRQIGGYKLSYDSTNDRVLATIPTSPDSTDDLVRTTLGFTRFTGINATDYVMINSVLVNATGNYVFKQGGFRDRRSHSTVADISFAAKTGYQMFARGEEMRVSMYRPKMRSNGTITVNTAVSFDQSGIYSPAQTTSATSSGTPWGSPWGSPWSSVGVDRNDWLVGYGTGQSVSFSLSGSAACGVEWSGTDYEVVPGGMY